MIRVIKKPLIIHAVQWKGTNLQEMADFLYADVEDMVANQPIIIETLEGDMTAKVGCYIMMGVRGEYWPVQEEIFLETYEVLE